MKTDGVSRRQFLGRAIASLLYNKAAMVSLTISAYGAAGIINDHNKPNIQPNVKIERDQAHLVIISGGAIMAACALSLDKSSKKRAEAEQAEQNQ